MQLTLGPDAERLVEQLIRQRNYRDIESVVLAGLQKLSEPEINPFASGALEALLADGERSFCEEGTIDGDDALIARKASRAPSSGAA